MGQWEQGWKKGSSVAPCLSSGPNTLPSCSRAFPYTADLTSCLSPFPAYSSPNRGPLLEAASLTLPKTFTHRSLCLSGLSTGHHMASFFSLSAKMAVCDRPFYTCSPCPTLSFLFPSLIFFTTIVTQGKYLVYLCLIISPPLPQKASFLIPGFIF